MLKKKDLLTSPKFRQKKRRRLLLRLFLVIFSIILIVGSVSYIFSSSFFTIQTIQVEGASRIPKEDIESIVKNDIAGKYWHLISRSNSLFYPKNVLQADILQKFPAVETISLSLSSPTILSVRISERVATALWCKENNDKKESCYLVDNSGLVFADAQDASGDGYIRYSGGDLGDTPIGKNFLSPSLFQNLALFVSSLQSDHLDGVSIFVRPDGDFEITLLGGQKILLGTQVSFDRSLENLASFLNSPDTTWKPGQIPATVQYIDLRFGNKIFFLNKKGQATASSTSVGTTTPR